MATPVAFRSTGLASVPLKASRVALSVANANANSRGFGHKYGSGGNRRLCSSSSTATRSPVISREISTVVTVCAAPFANVVRRPTTASTSTSASVSASASPTPPAFPHARAFHSDYHSSLHPEPTPPADTDFSPEQAAILAASLAHIPSLGFSDATLRRGAHDAGYPDVSLQLLTGGGYGGYGGAETALVLYYLAERRGQLEARVMAGQVEGLSDSRGVEERVRRLVWERLMMNREVIMHWQEALTLLTLPTNIPAALHELYALASTILHLAGDVSVDSSWYTNRLLTAGAYASADVIMTEDRTVPEFTATREFIDRRLGDARMAANRAADLSRLAEFVSGTVAGVGRSWGMRI